MDDSVNSLTPPPSPTKEESKRLVFANEETIVHDDPPLSLCKKLTFAVGSMPYAMCNTVLGFYMTIFLLEVVILSPRYVLVIVFAGRVWDSITDPLVGYLCTRTRTRIGHLRPWMMVASPFAAIAYVLFWFVPPAFTQTDYPQHLKFVYYLIIYFLFQALLSCIHVPYTALTMHLSHSGKDRDSATLYRMCFEVMGTMLGVIIYTLCYLVFVDNEEDICSGGVRLSDPNKIRVYRYQGAIIAVITLMFVWITAFGVKEQQEEIEQSKNVGFVTGIRTTLGFWPYLCLMLFELFVWLAVQFVQGNFALYVKYSLKLKAEYPYVIATLLVATIMWMVMWQRVIAKCGKKTTASIGIWLFMPPLVLQLYLNYEAHLIYPVALIAGLGVAAVYLLPWSMLPDAIDMAHLKTGVRREELFYAFFVFGNKFASGVTLGISTGIYEIVGYDENACTQEWQVGLSLKLLVSVPPVLFLLIGLVFLALYPITEKMRAETKRQLQERRRSKGAVYGSTDNSKNQPDGGHSITAVNFSKKVSTPDTTAAQTEV